MKVVKLDSGAANGFYRFEKPPRPRRHLTTEDLAERLRCSRYTVQTKWRLWGLKPIRGMGKRLLFTEEDVERCERERQGS
jgi:hypothetical protein